MSLKTMESAAARLPAPLVTLVLSRTVAKVDSIGLVVRRWIQCSAGKSKNASSSSSWSTIRLTTLGVLRPVLLGEHRPSGVARTPRNRHVDGVPCSLAGRARRRHYFPHLALKPSNRTLPASELSRTYALPLMLIEVSLVETDSLLPVRSLRLSSPATVQTIWD